MLRSSSLPKVWPWLWIEVPTAPYYLFFCNELSLYRPPLNAPYIYIFLFALPHPSQISVLGHSASYSFLPWGLAPILWRCDDLPWLLWLQVTPFWSDAHPCIISIHRIVVFSVHSTLCPVPLRIYPPLLLPWLHWRCWRCWRLCVLGYQPQPPPPHNSRFNNTNGIKHPYRIGTVPLAVAVPLVPVLSVIVIVIVFCGELGAIKR